MYNYFGVKDDDFLIIKILINYLKGFFKLDLGNRLCFF